VATAAAYRHLKMEGPRGGDKRKEASGEEEEEGEGNLF
jgi:hypothetical protein